MKKKAPPAIAIQPISRKERLVKNLPYLSMMLIPSVLLLIFNYWPMIGLSMAFQNYRSGELFLGPTTQWVGLKWFRMLFKNPMFGRLIRNTLLLSLYDLAVSFPLCVLLAVLLNEIRHRGLRKFTTNVSMLPYFISTVVVVGILTNFLSVDNGIINNLIADMGGKKVDFMGSSKWFRTLYVFSGVWQGAGFSAMIYTAAIAGIDPTLYEAAAIDGSTRFKNIYMITLPCILPTIVVMLILRIGGLLSSSYEKIILMYSPAIYETADTLGTYSYRAGILDQKTSMSTAIGLFNAVCNVVLLVIANWGSRKVTESSLF
ncbi:MAG: ABC transporter permease subunit [Candidatus Faecivicinus sp.]|nr:ABC transporter permease subunit [Candidatus Faecivicinus sp.]